MQKIIIKKIRKDILILTTVIFSIITMGAVIFHYLEGWTFMDSFYFAAMTATTVGYGDFVPTSAVSKIITTIYALSIIPFVLYGFAATAKAQSEWISEKMHYLEKKQKKQEAELSQQQKKIKNQLKNIVKEEDELKNEISEHDKELEVVEDIMEKELIK